MTLEQAKRDIHSMLNNHRKKEAIDTVLERLEELEQFVRSLNMFVADPHNNAIVGVSYGKRGFGITFNDGRQPIAGKDCLEAVDAFLRRGNT